MIIRRQVRVERSHTISSDAERIEDAITELRAAGAPDNASFYTMFWEGGHYNAAWSDPPVIEEEPV